jgi:site-specific DNA-methyltransferase (adenine-specific)
MKTEVYKHLKDLRALKMAVEQTIKVARDEKRFVASVPYTPVELIGEICDNIPAIKNKQYDAAIGVFFTVEAAAYLIYLGFTNVTVITDVQDDLIALRAAMWGYKYLLIAEVEKEEMKFDVIVGNPPYQSEVANHQHRLWMQFVDKAFTLIVQDGVVAMVTPNNWATTPKLYDRWFANKKVLHINMNECERHFPGIGISFSWYAIQNSDRDETTTRIVTANQTFDRILPVEPIGSNSDALTIFAKTIWNSDIAKIPDAYAPQTHYSYFKAGKVSKVETDVFCHRVLLTPASSKREARWIWGKVICEKQTGPRVITSMWPGAWRTGAIVTADLQTSHSYIHIPVASIEQAEILKSYLTSKLITYIVLALNSMRNINPRTIRQLPLVDLTRTWTDAELYAHFKLTKEEIELIESTIK